MTTIHIPMRNQPAADSQDAETRYRNLFPEDAIDLRRQILEDAGFDSKPSSGAQRAAAGSLTWGTATEGALRIFAGPHTAVESPRVGIADAIAAAVRVSRGLSQDKRTCGDPWADELLAAAHTLISPSHGRVMVTLDTAKTFLDQSRTGTLTLESYLGSFTAHGYALAGTLLADFDLVAANAQSTLASFMADLGALYALTTEHGQLGVKAQRYTVSPLVRLVEDAVTTNRKEAWSAFAGSKDGTLLRSFVVTKVKSLLSSGDVLLTVFPDEGDYRELYLRARITLNATKDLLRDL